MGEVKVEMYMDKTNEKEKNCMEKWGANREVKQQAKASTLEKERDSKYFTEQGSRGIDFDRQRNNKGFKRKCNVEILVGSKQAKTQFGALRAFFFELECHVKNDCSFPNRIP